MFISDIQTTVMVLMNNSNEIKLSKLPVSRKVKAYTTGKDILSDLTFDISKEIIWNQSQLSF
jgi:hypothetical protein